MNFFRDIIEQDRAKTEFYNSFRQNRLNHAYLLVGENGIGKCSLARAVAASYLCHNPVDEEACGECKSCRLLEHGSHPDFLELPREPKELRIRRFTPRTGSGSEDIDHPSVLEFMRLKPMNGAGRVCIIPDIERINIEAANAFLKTLEEPPPESLILLTSSNKDRLLSTITSRCRIICMNKLTENSISAFLTNRKGYSETDSEHLTYLAEGSLGRALNIAESDTLDEWEQICKIDGYRTPAEAVRYARQLVQRIKSCKDATSKREIALKFFDMLSLYIRKQMRQGLSARKGYKALEQLWKAGEILSANVRPELVALNAVANTVTALYKG